jgi:hypothetical protein
MFWGNSVESKTVFQQQKRIIRMMTRSKFYDQKQTVVSKIGNTKLTVSVHTLPDEVPFNKFGNLKI